VYWASQNWLTPNSSIIRLNGFSEKGVFLIRDFLHQFRAASFLTVEIPLPELFEYGRKYALVVISVDA